MPGLEDELGDVVTKARTGAGLSLGDLAARSGLSESELKAIEVYTGHPAAPQVRRLATVLDLRPDALWELAQDSWSAPEVPWSIGGVYGVDRLTSDWPEHCYVITAPSGECLVVDPGDDADRITGVATRDGRRPLAVLVTHRHRDHTGAVVAVQRATGVPVYVDVEDVEGAAGVPVEAVRRFAGDAVLEIGPFSVRALGTPGHTPGSVTYVLEAGGSTGAFCGDTLFAGSAGRAGFSYQALREGLRRKLATLPPETVLYPGHGPATTLANELERNPFL